MSAFGVYVRYIVDSSPYDLVWLAVQEQQFILKYAMYYRKYVCQPVDNFICSIGPRVQGGLYSGLVTDVTV
jgi:hypothetical protein